MAQTCTIDETIYRCTLCETLFEAGVADDADGDPRCPQCGFHEAEPVRDAEECGAEVVIRRTTRFR